MRQVSKKGLITVVATGGVLAVTSGYAYADAGASSVAAHSPGVLSGNTVQAPVTVPVNACGNTVDVVGALNPTFGNSCSNGSQHGAYAHNGQSQADQGHAGHGNDEQWHSSGDHAHGVAGHDHGDHALGRHHGGFDHSTTGRDSGAQAHAVAAGSPGIGSGNVVQVPVDVPVNACGNSVDVVALLNPAFGNSCSNSGGSDTGQGYTPPPPHSVLPPQQGHKPQPPVHRNGHKPVRPAHPVVAKEHPLASPGAPTLAHTGADQIGWAGAASAGLLIGGFVLYRRGRAARR